MGISESFYQKESGRKSGTVHFEGRDSQKLGTFSKGMRQKVGIAQAVLHSPAVLFLDEPTSGLDPEGVRTLHETTVRLNSELGMTVFMNTHVL
ncbi:ATP-binding cassette domain-containing protein [Cryobacterium sp. M91]|uniref:ATP-binding cassette domain-containing protein n=1 Tax=Cryobacterium sp. M91 TaxID=2048294 RepID=UPI001E2989E4|nr:ATP-binding cassette domain-containing protein [Cryobacterium sp. M91]